MSTAVSGTTQKSSSSAQSTGASDAYMKQVIAAINNSSTTPEQLNALLSQSQASQLNFAQQTSLQSAMTARQQLITMLTNMLRTIADISQSVIRNIRP